MESFIFLTHDLFVPVLVNLYEDERYIGSGQVVSLQEPGQKVHNTALNHNEVVIAVQKLDVARLLHPIHKYTIEVGAYTAWKLDDLEVMG